MKRVCAALAAVAFLVSVAGGGWLGYPVPDGVTYFSSVTTNNNGFGCATGAVNHSPGAVELEAGTWKIVSAPPYYMTRASVARDGTLYAIDTHGTGNIWRLAASGGYWNVVVTGGFIGVSKFYAVAAVGAREFWAFGVDNSGDGKIVHFENDMPGAIFDLGRVSVGSEGAAHTRLVLPRTANPSGEVYFAVNARSTEFGQAGWYLFVLKPSGALTYHRLPQTGTGDSCDGLAAYSPGNVRVAMTVGLNQTRIYSFDGREFVLRLTLPERVALKVYPSPSDGWGVTYTNRVYHWSDSGFSDVLVFDGVVRDLDMIDGQSGWAVGGDGTGLPKLWRYRSNPNITPTSLGRVKALFR